MSREFRDFVRRGGLEAKADDLEEKKGGKGMIRGGSRRMFRFAKRKTRQARNAASEHWQNAFNGAGSTARLPRDVRLAESRKLGGRVRRRQKIADYLRSRVKRRDRYW